MTETINVESVAPATAVTINRDQVKQMTDALKGAKYASVTITSDQLAGCRVQVANGNAIFETTGTKVAFPDWRRLVEHCDNAPALDCTIGFAPKQVRGSRRSTVARSTHHCDSISTAIAASLLARQSARQSLTKCRSGFHKLSPNFSPSGWGRWFALRLGRGLR